MRNKTRNAFVIATATIANYSMVPGTGNENGADIGFAPFVGKLCVIFLPLDNFGQKPLAIIRRLGIPPVADASGKRI